MEQQQTQRKFLRNEYYFLGTKILQSRKEDKQDSRFGVVDLYKLTYFDDGSIFYNLENPFVSEDTAKAILTMSIPRFAKVALEIEQAMDLRSKPRLLNLKVLA